VAQSGKYSVIDGMSNEKHNIVHL